MTAFEKIEEGLKEALDIARGNAQRLILKPVTDKTGVVLLDIYEVDADGTERWCGSRRTYRQCVTVLGLDKPQDDSVK